MRHCLPLLWTCLASASVYCLLEAEHFAGYDGRSRVAPPNIDTLEKEPEPSAAQHDAARRAGADAGGEGMHPHRRPVAGAPCPPARAARPGGGDWNEASGRYNSRVCLHSVLEHVICRLDVLFGGSGVAGRGMAGGPPGADVWACRGRAPAGCPLETCSSW